MKRLRGQNLREEVHMEHDRDWMFASRVDIVPLRLREEVSDRDV